MTDDSNKPLTDDPNKPMTVDPNIYKGHYGFEALKQALPPMPPNFSVNPDYAPNNKETSDYLKDIERLAKPSARPHAGPTWMHAVGCINAEVNHLGGCLVRKVNSSDYVHAAYCTIEDDEHDGPCLGAAVTGRRGAVVTLDGMEPTRELPVDLIPAPVMGKISWTPNHPHVEVIYNHPDGTSLNMTADIPDSTPGFNIEMAMARLSRNLESFICDLNDVREGQDVTQYGDNLNDE
jgi:hypothetical protein